MTSRLSAVGSLAASDMNCRRITKPRGFLTVSLSQQTARQRDLIVTSSWTGLANPVAWCVQLHHTMSASAQASTRDAVLSLLLERGEDEAGSLAEAVGISVQAMRDGRSCSRGLRPAFVVL